MPSPHLLIDSISSLMPSFEATIDKEAQPPALVTVNFRTSRSGSLNMTSSRMRRSIQKLMSLPSY